MNQMLSLRIGDIVARYEADGRVTLRVIRHVSSPTKRSRNLVRSRFMVQCVKQRISRYPSPVTGLYPQELLSRSYQYTGKRARLRSRLDRLVAAHCAARSIADPAWRSVTQRDVVGVIA